MRVWMKLRACVDVIARVCGCKLRACVDVIARVCGCMGVDACAYESGGVDACVRMCVCLNLHLLPWTRVGPWPSRVRPPRRRWSFRI